MGIRLEDSTTIVAGFRFSAAAAEIKTQGRLDFALAAADTPASVAGLFTTNIVRAAPVVLAAERARRGRAQALLVNSGCANACTGEAGLAAAHDTTAAVARALALDPRHVLPASTGVIGTHLPVERLVARVPALVAELAPDGADRFAEAILTTDRGPKVAHARGEIAGRPFTVLGIAKGAGMIHPTVAPLVPHATMLAFLFTDAVADARALEAALGRVAEETFNRASVDGDTSTNDALIALASGRAGTETGHGAELAPQLEEAMGLVSERLARAMVADGEGAEHLVEIVVSGTTSHADALVIARTIATSPLVKTALYGQDPNWGRVLGAAGRAGVAFDPNRARIAIGGVVIVERGVGVGTEQEGKARLVMAEPSYTIEVVLGDGPGRARYLACDLGIGYVRCNASYRS
ncbi:MAG TPA: bifunctional glutamate N-acetyltransferase/amino-acid acetyltransferase ArgJ [Polyangiaceae bacterium]|nr:bifunctional glutamate N-acetyltransferase/amino-acid acetyltransferase ArgJ [Polyangiaceae bacterium]